MERLTVPAIKAAKHPGTHARPVRIGDGKGLYLQVAPGGTKSWLFRFMLAGKSREMGLGSVDDVPLNQAREKARAARGQLQAGQDPIEARRDAEKVRQALAQRPTFRQATVLYHDAHRAG